MERIVSLRLDTYHVSGDEEYTENERTGTWTADIEYFGRNWEDVFTDVRETVREWVGQNRLSRGWYVDNGMSDSNYLTLAHRRYWRKSATVSVVVYPISETGDALAAVVTDVIEQALLGNR